MEILSKAFDRRIASLSIIFESYSVLHGVYHAILRSANVPERQYALFEKTRDSAIRKQNEISDSLHTQAFILMTGSAEALLKDLQDDLILENFTRLNNLSDVKFEVGELTKIIKESEQGDFVSLKLAESVIRQLGNGNTNPQEKVNFQNPQSMRDGFSRLFGIQIDTTTELYLNIRSYWLKRHALVHSEGIADKRYVDNMRKAGFDVKEGDRVIIAKIDYDRAVGCFRHMFSQIEAELVRLGLSFEGIG